MKNFLAKLSKLVYSRTAWVNLLMLAAIIIPRLMELPQLTLSPEITSFILFLVNLVLRFITNKPLEDK